MPRTPTPEQVAVLDCASRIRLVRASPGSGKTWLIAELVQRELDAWPRGGSGLSALSFTRVGGKEIRDALGNDPPHPHFVGTIDAFLFKYIVRPFFAKMYGALAPPRLIPADWSPGHWGQSSIWTYRGSGGAQAINYNLLEVCFVGEHANSPILKYRNFHSGAMDEIQAIDVQGVFSAKRSLWKKHGWLTHADMAFVAGEILGCPIRGHSVRVIVRNRFPLLIIDELQDTGYYLGKCLRLLLGESGTRGVLVGDPDQAIYEFNGARPDLLDEYATLPGTTVLPLAKSRRCPQAIVSCATAVKDSPGSMGPAEDRDGRAFVVEYTDMAADVRRLAKAIHTSIPSCVIKVITRYAKTIDELLERDVQASKSLYCPPLNHLLRAVKEFRSGRNAKALAAARASFDLAAFDQEGVSDKLLVDAGVDVAAWKQAVVTGLLKCNAISTSGTLYDWQTSAGKVLDEIAMAAPTASCFQPGKFKPQKRKGWDSLVSHHLPSSSASESPMGLVPVQTIHGVKGETHDVTVLVCRPSKPDRCPSAQWWPTSVDEREEKRIAYVAMTRSRSDLILCLSRDCRTRLATTRPDFMTNFRSLSVDECISTYQNGGT